MPPLWPDLIFRLLPGVGLLSTCAALTFLVALRRVQMDGFLAVIYVQRVLDLLLGLSLFYAGFHGIHLSVQYGSEQDAHQMPPIQCLFTALHLHIWVYTDSAQLLLLTLLCVDQFISVAWTKRHKEFSEYYFHPGVLAVLLVCASGAFVPAWHAPIRLADNGTVQISSFCEMPETFGQHFYGIYLLVRELAPVPAIGALSATAFAVLTLQLIQRGRFKWSDNNCQSAKCLLLILCRSLLLLAAVHLPLATLRRPRLSHELLEFREHGQEVALRAFHAALFAMTGA
ncbi:hypothetical protein GPALN_014606 [Globodera pallida]|uniref:G_PROTEIN_RECEP_F1_2 domain-containing protein n=1 Tax=Globodera pallida TaxID=36090 RepID=A0A183BT74_GLOPA|nr:hypothetical protein GPALN_014606 [Globodera pallida]